MFEDFMKKLRKGISAEEETEIPAFPTYEEVKPMNAERYEEIKKPTPTSVVDSGNHEGNIELKVVPHPMTRLAKSLTIFLTVAP